MLKVNYHYIFPLNSLYCHSVESSSRRAAVCVLNEILTNVTLVLAPLLPHLAEEIYLHHPLHCQ